MVQLIGPLLRPSQPTTGAIYRLIANWPFACYLTTNYDDEIHKHLSSIGQHFAVVRNRPQDFYVWRDGVSSVVQKLHSDLNHPRELILTSEDYTRLDIEPGGQYYRDGLLRIFTMFDVLIIGHSLNDPDISLILKLARSLRDPTRPIYMIGTGFTLADEKDYFEQYNIVLVQYPNDDGNHAELLRLLRTADRFIVSRRRHAGTPSTAPQSADVTSAAMTISLYRRLQGVTATDYLSPLILSGLAASPLECTQVTKLGELPMLNAVLRQRDGYEGHISDALAQLSASGHVLTADNVVSLTDEGRSTVAEFQRVREIELDQAYGQFRITLARSFSNINESELNQCELLAERAIVSSFADRGTTIANKVFSDQSPRAHELSDVFANVADQAAYLQEAPLRGAFIEAMHEFLVEPNEQQKRYLASVSQGYFLYHLLGLDPTCGETRREIFHKTLWLCDSSVILPRIALGCHNHAHAYELFRMLAAEDALLYTTPKLLREAWSHFSWALHFVEERGSRSLDLLRAALVKGSFRQNLFLDGYIRLRADGDVGTFREYISRICGGNRVSRTAFEEQVASLGLQVVDMSRSPGFGSADIGNVEQTKVEIHTARVDRGTYRSELQVEAEAEVSMLLSNLRSGDYEVPGLRDAEHFYFVSQSLILDRVNREDALLIGAVGGLVTATGDRESVQDVGGFLAGQAIKVEIEGVEPRTEVASLLRVPRDRGPVIVQIPREGRHVVSGVGELQ
ncbi:MAG: SIR2 family protein [Spirochaetaceae bacterium]|nr:SIR2 family protein [Spirochaetaceae bacterium]